MTKKRKIEILGLIKNRLETGESLNIFNAAYRIKPYGKYIKDSDLKWFNKLVEPYKPVYHQLQWVNERIKELQ